MYSSIMADKQVYIEHDSKTDKYVIREGRKVVGSKNTQAEAIDFARKKLSERKPLVERVRTTDEGKPDKWRKA
jgi:hypothetical protein